MFNSGGEPEPEPAPPSAPRAELPALEVETPEVTPDADRLCPTLMGGLPLVLADSQARPVRSASAYAAAWGDPPIVLRCGVPAPPELAADSSLLQINGVAWFTEPGEDGTVWTAVDREVYVDVQVPSGQASGPVALLSEVITDRLRPASRPSASPTPTR
ncbi:MAG: DUF3515 domain-containing protein [Actinomycetota bacterium]|nr:DUF3515 domain-containing protein [Actinomycetota bacterium]